MTFDVIYKLKKERWVRIAADRAEPGEVAVVVALLMQKPVKRIVIEVTHRG